MIFNIWAWGALIYFILCGVAASLGGFKGFYKMVDMPRWKTNILLWGALIVNCMLWPITLPLHIRNIIQRRRVVVIRHKE